MSMVWMFSFEQTELHLAEQKKKKTTWMVLHLTKNIDK